MTIGIGVLCSTQPKPHVPRPDALVMIADTMGSTDTDSTGELHKMLFDPGGRLYAVCADRIEVSAELLPLIRAELADIKGPRHHGEIWRALNTAVMHHRRERFMWDVVNVKYAVLGPGQIPVQEHDRLMAEWCSYDTHAQALIGTFDDDGLALLYYVGKLDGTEGLVHLMEFPGYFAIGAGCYNATVWLNYRGQTLGMSVGQSALHAYEASKMASSAPTVNQNIEILVATVSGQYHLSSDFPIDPNLPVSLPWLQSMAKRYAPRSTDALGFRKGDSLNPRSTKADPSHPPPSQESSGGSDES
jgi:hypothetical protein